MNLMREIHKLGFVQGDKSALALLIEAAEEFSAHLDRYTPSSVQPFSPALEGAQRILADGNAMQQEVDAAASALLDAMLGLRYRADKTPVSYTHLDVYKRQRLRSTMQLRSASTQAQPSSRWTRRGQP